MNDHASLTHNSKIMRGWALHEMAPWLLKPIAKDKLIENFQKLNETNPSVFIYTIFEGEIKIHDKPLNMRGWYYEGNISRAKSYKMYLESVIKKMEIIFNTQLAIFVGDSALENPDVPVFSFQKPKKNKSILLPDIDMLGRGFPVSGDKIIFQDKKCLAIFAGGSSGGTDPLTIANFEKDGAIPRIRSAEFFKGSSDVIFKIPVIVQCDTEETVEYLKSKGYGDGKSISWDEQLENKFIISIDGNGATCTRVSITLTSNSILLKYDSDSVLYYFQGLAPWVHYIPIDKNSDVIDVIKIEQKNPGILSSICVAAQHFAANFLTREATFCYTAHLLSLYASEMKLDFESGNNTKITSIGVLAHVQNYGDIRAKDPDWAGIIGSGSPIEGFTLWPTGEIEYKNLLYKVFYSDKKSSDFVAGGQFSGTVGQSRPVCGLEICLADTAIDDWILQLSVRFIDGSTLKCANSRKILVEPRNVPIEAFLLDAIKIN